MSNLNPQEVTLPARGERWESEARLNHQATASVHYPWVRLSSLQFPHEKDCGGGSHDWSPQATLHVLKSTGALSGHLKCDSGHEEPWRIIRGLKLLKPGSINGEWTITIMQNAFVNLGFWSGVQSSDVSRPACKIYADMLSGIRYIISTILKSTVEKLW